MSSLLKHLRQVLPDVAADLFVTERTERGGLRVQVRTLPLTSAVKRKLGLAVVAFANAQYNLNLSLDVLLDRQAKQAASKVATSSTLRSGDVTNSLTGSTPGSGDVTNSLTGSTPGSYFGASMCRGDLNGDGVDDVVLPAYGTSLPGAPQYGQVAIAYQLEPLVLGRVVEYHQDYLRFGYSCQVMDVNQDGQPDLVVGAPSAQGGHNNASYGNYTGLALIYFGPIHPCNNCTIQPNVTLGGQSKFEALGHSITKLDLPCLPTPMLALSSPFYGTQDTMVHQGVVYLLPTAATWQNHAYIDTSASLKLKGVLPFQWFGQAITATCMNNQPLLFVGSPGYHTENGSVGAVHIYQLHSSSTATLLATLEGEADRAKFGWQVQILAGEQLLVASPSEGQSLIEGKDMRGTVRLYSIAALLECGNCTTSNVKPLSSVSGSQDYQHLGWQAQVLNATTIVLGSPQHDFERGMVQLWDLQSSELVVFSSGMSSKARLGASLLAYNATVLIMGSPAFGDARIGRVDVAQLS
jgi:hypothetical protein